MSATTGAPWNLVYQEFTDIADISDAIQDLADSADVAVQSLYNAQTAGYTKIACRMTTATTQSIPNNTNTTITWPAGSEYFDNNTMIDNSITTDRITFTTTGIYLVSGRVTFASTGSGGGVRQVSVTHSAFVDVVGRNAQLGTVSSDAAISFALIVPAYVSGQFVTFQAYQNSSVALNLNTHQVQAFRLTPL